MKKILIIISGLVALAVLGFALAGVYKFNYLASKEGYDVDGNPIPSSADRGTIEVCDEFGTRYVSESTALESGLEYAQFGATFCPEYTNRDKQNNADSLNTSLTGNKWHWVDIQYADDTQILALSPDFVATFTAEGTFSSQTDCNSISATYSQGEAQSLMIGPLAMTRMLCPDSQEGQYAEALAQMQSYQITEEGNLVLNLSYKEGLMFFIPFRTFE